MLTNADEVWAALAWGAVSSVGLLVGAIAGSIYRMSHHAIAMGMSVGASRCCALVVFAPTDPGTFRDDHDRGQEGQATELIKAVTPPSHERPTTDRRGSHPDLWLGGRPDFWSMRPVFGERLVVRNPENSKAIPMLSWVDAGYADNQWRPSAGDFLDIAHRIQPSR